MIRGKGYLSNRGGVREQLRKFAAACTIISMGLTGCARSASTIPEDAKPVKIQVAEVYGDADAIVTVVSDDGFYETGYNLDRLFGEKGLKCTVAGIVSVVDPCLEQWKKLTENGVIDLVNHSYNHIRMQEGEEISGDAEQITHEIVDADKYYEKNWGKEQIVFVCPENQMCELGYTILSHHDFWAVRRGDRGYNSLSPENGTEPGQWFNLMCLGIQDEGTNTAVRNSWVDTAIAEHSWLIEMWHNVVEAEGGGYQEILVPEAAEHVDYLAEKAEGNEIWVATYTEAVKYLREKQNIEVTAFIDQQNVYVTSSLTNPEMPPKTFDQMLTVKLELPENVEIETEAGITQNQTDGITSVVMNITPNETYKLRIMGE